MNLRHFYPPHAEEYKKGERLGTDARTIYYAHSS